MGLKDISRMPPIILGEIDLYEMAVLAMGAGSAATPSGAGSLLHKLETARVVPDRRLPPDLVRIGSTVHYRTGTGELRQAILAYPVNADPDAGRVSVLSPLGTALVGLRPGQTIGWCDEQGTSQILTVLSVEQEAGVS